MLQLICSRLSGQQHWILIIIKMRVNLLSAATNWSATTIQEQNSITRLKMKIKQMCVTWLNKLSPWQWDAVQESAECIITLYTLLSYFVSKHCIIFYITAWASTTSNTQLIFKAPRKVKLLWKPSMWQYCSEHIT